MSRAAGRARRVEVAERIRAADALGGADYATAFETTGSDLRSAEQWVRAVFEGAPPLLRWFLPLGWRFVLGLRLGPRGSKNHVLGWKIVTIEPDAVTLEAQSALMTAQKVLRVDDSRVVLATFIRYERRGARVVWSAIAPIHHRTEPYLLGRAASRPQSPTA